MNVQLFAPFLTSNCNICTQKHGPWYHSDKIVSQELCKVGNPQDDMAEGKDADMWAAAPEQI